MANRGSPGPEARRRARASGVAVPISGRGVGGAELWRIIPSARSLGLAFLIAICGAVAWVGARETGVFAVRTIDVAGAPPPVARQVRSVLAPTRGTSLLKVDLGASLQAVRALPTVAGARLDRAYPHTLRIVVVPEHPVAVVRQGADSYLVAASGRVVAELARGARPALPRIWVGRTARLVLGEPTDGDLRSAIAAVAPLAGMRFPGRVSAVTATSEALVLRLRSGLELFLGDTTEIPLKLAVAARVIPLLEAETSYLDLSVPARPVAGTLNSQVEVEAEPSRTP